MLLLDSARSGFIWIGILDCFKSDFMDRGCGRCCRLQCDFGGKMGKLQKVKKYAVVNENVV